MAGSCPREAESEPAESSRLGGETSPAPGPAGGLAAAGEQRAVNGPALSEYLEGNLDPAAPVRASSDEALGRLADAL